MRYWLNYGHNFVYRKKKAVVLAKEDNRPVTPMLDELAANATTTTESIDEPHVVARKQVSLKAQHLLRNWWKLPNCALPPWR